jgi:MFS transporter, PPP family, 3-phenylpropionic acid transporter
MKEDRMFVSAEKDETNRQNLLLVKVIYFLYFSAFGIVTAYLNIYYKSIGLSGFQIGWIGSIVPLVALISSPFVGFITDRLSRPRLLIAIAALGAGCSILIISRLSLIYWILVFAGIYSFFVSTLLPQIDSVNLILLGENKEHYGQQRIFGSIGFIFSTWTVGLVFDHWGLKWMFPIYMFLMILIAVVLLFSTNFKVPVHDSTSLINSIRLIKPAALLFFGGIFFYAISNGGMNDYLGLYIKVLGGNVRLVGLSYSIGALAEVPIIYFGGKLLKKFGPQLLLIISMSAHMIRMILYAIMPDPSWVLPISLINSISFGLFLVTSVVYVKNLFPDHLTNSGQSLLWGTMFLASIVGSPINGYLFDQVGPSRLFMILAGVALISAVIMGVNWQINRELPARHGE